jgi:hypothetical protein
LLLPSISKMRLCAAPPVMTVLLSPWPTMVSDLAAAG